MIQFAAPAGVTKGMAALQGQEQDFRAGLVQAARYAKALGCADVHLMSGVATQHDAGLTFSANLEYAVKYFEDQGLRPLIEVISAQEVPGYYLSDFGQAQQLLETFPSIGLILDLYHAQLLTGDAALCWRGFMSAPCMCKLPTARGVTNRERAASTLLPCSRCWSNAATQAGSAVNTVLAVPLQP